MTEEEFRADLLAAVASRAEVQACGSREAFALEMLERLSESGEVPDAESCVEALTGHRGRKLEIDAWAIDDADGSVHLFVVILDGGEKYPPSISLTDAREQGFNRVLGVFEQSRDGWLTENIEESRPLWALARRIRSAPLPIALRVHVLTDRPISERLREIPGERTRENVPVTFQIWDVTRLKRIHDALSVRDDLVVDFSHVEGGGLPMLPASVGSGEYDGYLAVIPGEVLAAIYIRHGSRLLEGNVRTFLGRGGKVNKGIAATVAKEPAKFFAYNNGIAATASEVTTVRRGDGSIIFTSATDLQIVNGAQTTASLASAARDKTLAGGTVFVPMKLSVVTPTVASDLIPLISRFANSQNGVRASDFFANHAFHRRIEEVSRRVLAPAVVGSQVQTHWYYERARGQYLNDQAGLTAAKRNQFLLINPRRQVITKTDLAKVEC
ncbi:MAG: AIPR family protein, partial [Pseudolabrys sp.]